MRWTNYRHKCVGDGALDVPHPFARSILRYSHNVRYIVSNTAWYNVSHTAHLHNFVIKPKCATPRNGTSRAPSPTWFVGKCCIVCKTKRGRKLRPHRSHIIPELRPDPLLHSLPCSVARQVLLGKILLSGMLSFQTSRMGCHCLWNTPCPVRSNHIQAPL